MAIFIGVIVTSTVVEQTIFAGHDTHFVDIDEDGDNEELEVNDLKLVRFNENMPRQNVAGTPHISIETKVLYFKMSTPPPEC
jgi:hypothetical protein